MEPHARDTSTNHRPHHRSQPWVWVLLGFASVGLTLTPLLLATLSTAVTATVEIPSVVGLVLFGAAASRTHFASAESDVATNRRAISLLVAVVGVGSVLISLALQYGSAAIAVGVGVIAVVVVAAIVSARVRGAGPGAA